MWFSPAACSSPAGLLWRASTNPIYGFQATAIRLQRAYRRRLRCRAAHAASALNDRDAQKERAVRARPFAVQLSTLERLVKYNEFRATSLIVDRLRKKSELRRSQSQTKVGARMRIASARLRMERAAMATLKVIHSEGLSPTINRPARAAAVAKLEAIARMPITCVAAAPMFPPTPPNDQRLERSAVGAVATINAERTLRESHVRHIQAAVRKMRARRRVSLDMHASLQAKMRDRLFLESEAMRAAGLLQRAWLSALAQRTEMEVQVEVHDAAQVVERLAFAISILALGLTLTLTLTLVLNSALRRLSSATR